MDLKFKKCLFQNVTFDKVSGVPTLGPVCNNDFLEGTYCNLHRENAYAMATQWLAAYKGTHPEKSAHNYLCPILVKSYLENPPISKRTGRPLTDHRDKIKCPICNTDKVMQRSGWYLHRLGKTHQKMENPNSLPSKRQLAQKPHPPTTSNHATHTVVAKKGSTVTFTINFD